MTSQLLQQCIVPENAKPLENLPTSRQRLYYRLDSGPPVYEAGPRWFRLRPNTHLDCATLGNALSLAAWRQYTPCRDFYLHLSFRGTLLIFIKLWKTPPRTLVDNPAASDQDVQPLRTIAHSCDNEKETFTPVNIPLPLPEALEADWATIELYAEFPTEVRNLSWRAHCDTAPVPVRLAVVICSCHREELTRRKVRQLREAVPAVAAATLGIIVVDNGNTLTPEDFPPGVVLVSNPNTGGSGGFTRGIIEAVQRPGPQDEAYTHVLLTDDDAELFPDAVHRVIQLLSLAREEYASARICGAMMNLEDPLILHTSLERRDATGKLVRLHGNRPLWDWLQVMGHGVDLETMPHTYAYAPWWFCVLPVNRAILDDLPLPFFIRRDDVEYGLRFSLRGGKWMTLNGVCCFHPAFANRGLVPLTVYFSTRNSLIMEALYDFLRLELQVKAVRALLPGKYAYAVIQMHALRDFLAGPEQLETHPDLAVIARLGQAAGGTVRACLARRLLLWGQLVYLLARKKFQGDAVKLRWQEAMPRLTSLEFWSAYLQLNPKPGAEKNHDTPSVSENSG